MSLARFSVNQAVLVNLLFIVFVITGVVVYFLLPVDVYPDISLDEAWIQTPYPGASPEEVEQLVTKKIEEELEDIRGVARVTSNSVPSLSNIFIKFDENLSHIDHEAAFQEVRNRLTRVTELPEVAEEPILARLTLSEVWPTVQVVIVDEDGSHERVVREVTRNLKDRLREIPGIAKIRNYGIRDREVHILTDKRALEMYQLSLSEVAGILSKSNRNIPGGIVQTESEEFSLRAVGDAQSIDELGDIIIKKSPTGDHVYLRDVATIREDFVRRLVISKYMGKSCAFLYVAKAREADSITVRNQVDEVLTHYRANTLPPGVSIELFADSTLMISSRLNVLKKNMMAGLVLVFAVLWMFIGARNSMLAIVGIPFSFLCALIFMYVINVSINGVSVFALVLVSGMIVDDAIVVLENIYRHVQAGEPITQAVISGSEEVMWPVVSSVLTTIAAFLPLLIMSGVMGRFFSIIPKTVTVALLASLFECLIILPNHFLHWGPRKKLTASGSPSSKEHVAGVGIRKQALLFYQRVLEQTLAYRYLYLGVVIVLGACAYQAQRTLTLELFPSDFPTLVATFNINPEASLEQTDQICQGMMPLLSDLAENGSIKTYTSQVGMQWNEDNQMSQRSNLAQIWAELPQADGRGHDPEAVMDEIRQRLVHYVDAHPELMIENLKVWAIQDGPPLGKPIAIRVEHPDYEVASRVSDLIKDRLRGISGVVDISDNLDLGQRELQMVLKEAEASEFGLTFSDVFTTLSGANEGFVVGTFKDSKYDEDLDIRLSYQKNFRSSEDALLDVDIKSPVSQALVKLRQVADMRYDQGYANHYRHNGHRAVVVTADVDSHIMDAERVNQIISREFSDMSEQDDLLAIVCGGQFEETRESFRGLWRAGCIAVLIMYLILATQFKSYLQPLIVLSSLAFGTMGMIMGLVINGYPFSAVTGIALVGLFGVMVNDAILLVSFINRERANGAAIMDALITGSLTRVRPIILTTVTTVFGLLPMALGLGGYNKIWSPFATCMCWGLVFATVLILLLLPAFYLILEDIKRFFGGAWRKTRTTASLRTESVIQEA